MEPREPVGPRPPRLPNGWIVLGGSVLASFVWWLMMPAPARPPATPAPAVVPAPAEPAPATTGKPAAPTPARPRSDVPTSATPEAPAPEPAGPVAQPLLRVTTDVVGADVFVDRTFVGKTPFESRDVAPGGHQINVSAEGYDGMSRHVDVQADGPTDVSFAMKTVTLNAAVDVVHKHRLGSCEGRLSADLGGVRYTPKSGDDAFRAPLARLETFAVDYQDKQLRLKIKDGKSFNFTTRASNADPLLVFHRDVEKARTRLKGGA